MGIVYPVYIVRCSVEGPSQFILSPLSARIWIIRIPLISSSHSSSCHPIRIVVRFHNLFPKVLLTGPLSIGLDVLAERRDRGD